MATGPDLADGAPFARVELTGEPQFFHWDRHYHWRPPPLPDYDLWCILDGAGDVFLRGRGHALAPGLGFVLRPGDTPDARHDPEQPLVAFFCHFRPLDARGDVLDLADERLPPPAFRIQDTALFTELAQRCVACHRRCHPLLRHQARVVFEQMLLLAWAWWKLPPPTPGDSRIASIVQKIEQRPGQDWTVADLASQAHLSPSQFTRRFRAFTGLAPRQYLIQTRLRLARQLVLESDLSLKEIAAELGFQDEGFFNRQFRGHFGTPPGALRARKGAGRT